MGSIASNKEFKKNISNLLTNEKFCVIINLYRYVINLQLNGARQKSPDRSGIEGT